MRRADGPDPYTPRSGDGAIHVAHYDLDLDYRVASNRLQATATLAGSAREETRTITLDLSGLAVRGVRVAGDPGATHTHRDRRLVVRLSRALAAGDEFSLAVTYGGSPKPRRSPWGTLGWEELDDGVIVASQPIGASTWFPCNDVPSDKATYRIAVTTESAYRVVAGDLVRRTVRGGRTRWEFAHENPTASYLVTVQIGRYRRRVVDLDGVPGEILHPAGLAVRVGSDMRPLPDMMAAFQRAFGPYPFPEYRVVVTPDDLEIPLEAQGTAIFGAGHIDGRGTLTRLIAHELAHQWFGNAVGVAAWRHIWLNEGAACYAEWIWSEASGSYTAHENALGFHARLAGEPQDLAIADPGPAKMFDDRLYKRGALCLHALRITVGDDDFFRILSTWTSRYAGQAVVTGDFVALCEEVSGRGLGDFFDAWLEGTDLPDLPDAGFAADPAPVSEAL
ncbi:M1 family aminopeptidase [Microbacterium excoecariae]|uniref:M1 family aminopeptidase n=1 Tax=Microbacterium excoecariae TaxID=2715210 RepID=UPI00140CF949|nr:M1 family metallopeptidase [Microbacterium excoecariae]